MKDHPRPEFLESFNLYRPRIITVDPAVLVSRVGLFGTCGAPASTWREDIFIPELEKYDLEYFNPQVGPGEWTPEMAIHEAEHLATDEVIIFPISKETHGYGSLAEAGWAMLSSLLRGQKLGIFVEDDPSMPEAAQRARTLFRLLASRLYRDYPVFQFEESMEDLAQWAAITMKEIKAVRGSYIRDVRTISLPEDTEIENRVGIWGTSIQGSGWKKEMKKAFEAAGVDYYDPYKEDWTRDDAVNELEPKTKARIILQVITGETESFGSLAESGLLALSAFVRGQAYGLYIEPHPGDPKSDTNRARILVKAHAQKLNEQFPGLVKIADSIQELQEWAILGMQEA